MKFSDGRQREKHNNLLTTDRWFWNSYHHSISRLYILSIEIFMTVF